MIQSFSFIESLYRFFVISNVVISKSEFQKNRLIIRKYAWKDNSASGRTTIGDEITAAGETGSLIASSGMGITIFDLFSEVLEEKDMMKFLKKNNVIGNGFYKL